MTYTGDKTDVTALIKYAQDLEAEVDRLQRMIKLAHYALTKSSLTLDERVYDATGVLSRQLTGIIRHS